MIQRKGIGTAYGLVRGEAYLYLHHPVAVAHDSITSEQVPGEIRRFHQAVDAAIALLREGKGDKTSQSIIDTHVMMLEDPAFKSQVEDRITQDLVCAPWAVESVAEQMVSMLDQSGDASLKERCDDLRDVSFQVIECLEGRNRGSLDHLDHDVILVSDRLMPSELFLMDKTHVKGIALDSGGPTSHVAILTRSLRIPSVIGLGDLSSHVRPASQVVVNGFAGSVVVDPDQDTLEKFHYDFQRLRLHDRELEKLARETTVMKDGRMLHLMANIEMIEEVDHIHEVGCDGVGLFRSEYLIINQGENVSEEVQFNDYRTIIEKMAPKPVTIRTFDVGGDKVVPGLGIDEQNPILGWRAVRFCLSRRDIFLTQLRALLRASVYGKLRIMFPMISGVGELDAVLDVLEEAKRSLAAAGIPYDKDVQVGTMIEVPSAALCADLLAKRVDFFSIGTNDLIQYTLAVDRGNEKISYLYQPFHPAVLRSIRMVIAAAHAAHIPCGMCGEMAGDPRCSVLLAGLGLDEFSMDPQKVLEVRSVLRSVSWQEAKELKDRVMTLESADAVSHTMEIWMKDHQAR